MKKIFSILSLLMSINFVSAFNLSEALSGIDESLVVLIALFIIIFSLTFFALKNVFKDNPTIAGVVAAAVSFLAIYGINKSEFNTEDFVLNIGISESSFALLVFLVIIAGIIFMFIKLKANALLVLGLILIVASFFVYAQNMLLIIGSVLIISRLFMKINDKETANKSPKK